MEPRDASDIDEKTERSKWAGAHESMRATSEFQRRLLMVESVKLRGSHAPLRS